MIIAENKYYNSRGGSSAWRRLRAQVIREEPQCRLRLEGCTGYSQTADHIIPKVLRPDLVMVRANCQGACRHCNAKRGKKTLAQARAPRVTAARALDFFR
jgi:5-methylcytosine-specific restriction endonuclease McrA